MTLFIWEMKESSLSLYRKNEAERALGLIRMSRYGNGASIIGEVTEGIKEGEVILRTKIGGKRRLDVLTGEGLPRIC